MINENKTLNMMTNKNYFENFCTWVEACQLFGSIKDMANKLGVDEQFIQEADNETNSYEDFCKLLVDNATQELTEEDFREAELHLTDMEQMAQYDNLVNFGIDV